MAQDGASETKPPYISFATFKTFISDLKEQGVPERIDKHVWRHRFAGGVGPYLVSGLRFFGLLTDIDGSTDALKAFVQSHGTDHWKKGLEALIRRSYGPVMKLDLHTIAAGHLSDSFANAYGLEGNTLRKAITFFVHAAKDADIAIGPRITKGTRTVSPRKKPNGPTKPKADGAGEGTPASKVLKDPPPPPSPRATAWNELLLEKFPAFDPAWPDDVKAKWFEGFQQLMRKGRE